MENKDLASVGQEILRASRNELFLNMPYLDEALYALAFVPGDEVTVSAATDGSAFYYNGAYLAAHAPDALALALRENDADGLRLLLRTAQPDDAALAGALELSRELRRTEATAILLEAGHRRSAAARAKRYAL